ATTVARGPAAHAPPPPPRWGTPGTGDVAGERRPKERAKPRHEREDSRAQREGRAPLREHSPQIRSSRAEREQAQNHSEEESEREQRAATTPHRFRRSFDLRPDISDDPYARRECAGSGTGRKQAAERGDEESHQRIL